MTALPDKKSAFAEIRKTIEFLIQQRDVGLEVFEVSDFFKPELEKKIVGNFNNIIEVQEYEKFVYSILGAGKSKSEITEPRVFSEVQKLIRQYRLRSLREILKRVADTLKPVPSEIELLRDLVQKCYNRLMREPLRNKLKALIKEGATDFRMVMNTLRREKFEVSQEMALEEFSKLLAEANKSKVKLGRGGRGKKMNIKLDYGAVEDNRKKQRQAQARNALMRKSQYKKQRFIKVECPKIRFKETSMNIEGESRFYEHEGQVHNTIIGIHSVVNGSRVLELDILVRHANSQSGAQINAIEFQKISGKREQAIPFLQIWLKKVINQSHFVNIQEVIWFMSSVLNEKFGLPLVTAAHLKRNFIDDLIDLDKTINSFLIEKAVENA